MSHDQRRRTLPGLQPGVAMQGDGVYVQELELGLSISGVIRIKNPGAGFPLIFKKKTSLALVRWAFGFEDPLRIGSTYVDDQIQALCSLVRQRGRH